MGRTHTTSSYGSSGGKLFPVSGSTQAIISPAVELFQKKEINLVFFVQSF